MRLALVFVLFCVTVLGQDCKSILLTGKVVDTLRPQGFYNLVIVNKTTGKGVFGLPNGQFQLFASKNDEITFSIRGYNPIRVIVKPDSNCQAKSTIYIEQKPQELKEVVVKPLKTLEQIKEERSALALRETRQVVGLEMIQSPITALYQAFSRTEKHKKIVAQKKYEDGKKAVVQELLRVYVAYDIINLNEQEFDDFIAFLNVDEDFLKTSSEMELITFIQDKFEHFIALR